MSYVNEDAVLTGGMLNWVNGQIGISITVGTNTYLFSDYVRMSVNRTANYNVYHSVGKHNRGYIKLPKSYTFTVTIGVTSKDVQILRSLFVNEAIFTFEYYDIHGINKSATTQTDIAKSAEFKLIKQKLINCILTNMNDSYEVEGMPMVIFNGTALEEDFIADFTPTATYTSNKYSDNSFEASTTDVSDAIEDTFWTLI